MDATTHHAIHATEDWVRRLAETLGSSAQASVLSYLQRQRWFGAKGRRAVGLGVRDLVVLQDAPAPLLLALLEVRYAEGPSEVYSLPLVVQPEALREEAAGRTALLFTLKQPEGTALVLEATREQAALFALLEGVRAQRRWSGVHGVVACAVTRAGVPLLAQPAQEAKVLAAEQSNTSIVYDRRLIVKLIRKLEPGLNPDAEILGFLTERTSYRHIPVLAGVIRYEGAKEPAAGLQYTLAVAQPFVPNEGDGWSTTLAQLAVVLGHARASAPGVKPQALPALAEELARDLLADLGRLGRITAELHRALASDYTVPAFRPEAITVADCARWRADMDAQVRGVFRGAQALAEATRTTLGLRADTMAQLEQACLDRLEDLSVLARGAVAKIRHHGDYHLGQVLKTGADFVILDFEGEPARPLAARREKACALRDVAGMLRSFDYAAEAAARSAGSITADERALLEGWRHAAVRVFLDAYFEAASPGQVAFLPGTRGDAERVLKTYELDKAVYELRYELNSRPDWIGIPLEGIRRLLS